MKCLVDMEEQGEIPSDLRIKRYTPESDELKQILRYIHEFLTLHSMKHTLVCLEREVNWPIDPLPIRRGKAKSVIAETIAKK
jgi:hypothetical protein